jgi:hypothetical protein
MARPWWWNIYPTRRIIFAIGCEALIALFWIGAIWLLERALDISKVGDHVLFGNAVEGVNWHYGVRVGALFDLLDLTALGNFVYRSYRHWNRTYQEDE